jgi:hypothetical protein
MPQVFDFDSGKLGNGLGQRVRAVPVGKLDRQLVNRTGTITFENVDPDEISSNLADPGSELAEGSRTVRQPHPDDNASRHEITVRVSCERTVSTTRTPE